MAHHRSTPASVMEAPTITPVVVHANKGMSREQRRARGNRQRASSNTPFVGKVRDALPSAVDLKERV